MKLTESDFRKIQRLISKKFGTKYSLDYIRKVCNGKRNNKSILDMASQYIQIIQEMESKIERLSEPKDESKLSG